MLAYFLNIRNAGNTGVSTKIACSMSDSMGAGAHGIVVYMAVQSS